MITISKCLPSTKAILWLFCRWLHAHEMSSSSVQIWVVLELWPGVEQNLHGRSLVWLAVLRPAHVAAKVCFHQGQILNSLLKQNSQWFQGHRVQKLAQLLVFAFLHMQSYQNPTEVMPRVFNLPSKKSICFNCSSWYKEGWIAPFWTCAVCQHREQAGLPWGTLLDIYSQESVTLARASSLPMCVWVRERQGGWRMFPASAAFSLTTPLLIQHNFWFWGSTS